MDVKLFFHRGVFLLSVHIAIGLSNILPRRSSVSFISHKSHYHPGSVYKSLSVSFMMRCADYCTADLSCVSFNINKTSHQCNLLGEILEEGELLPDVNMDFYGKNFHLFLLLHFIVLVSCFKSLNLSQNRNHQYAM